MITGRNVPTAISWDQSAPREAPFRASIAFAGLRTTGAMASYTTADTWYPSWAADDSLYSPFTDGSVLGLHVLSRGEDAATGHARILGDDPLDLEIDRVGDFATDTGDYKGRYPGGSLAHDGVWYYATYCLDKTSRGLDYDILGPLVGFRTSTDGGLTWTETRHTPSEPLFEESGYDTKPVKFGSPHFVDFGKNMERSPDGYAYLVGHGSMTSRAQLSWISGDDIFLARVIPTVVNINDRSAWEFFAGGERETDAHWSQELDDARPIASWPGHMGCATITYHAPSTKFLMCVTDGWPTIKEMNSYVLESDTLTGGWRMAAYMEDFGKQAYFLNFPSKFISDDGTKMWLCYSANFTSQHMHPSIDVDPAGSRYALCLLELELIPTPIQ